MPLAAATFSTGRLSPTTSNRPGYLVLSLTNASPALNPRASATRLLDSDGAESAICAKLHRCPRSFAGPHRIAPAPTALGPFLSNVKAPELCLAPPSKDTRYSAGDHSGRELVNGGSGARRRSPAWISLVAIATSLHALHSGHRELCQQQLSGASACVNGVPRGPCSLNGQHAGMESVRNVKMGVLSGMSCVAQRVAAGVALSHLALR